MNSTRVRWAKKAKTHLRAAVPPEWRLRVNAARATGSPECLWRPMKLVERRWAEARFRSKQGRELELDPPRTFNEKVQWRLLYDRRPIWRTLRDKYRVRNFVRSRVGDEHLIPLLHETRSPSKIPFHRLRPPYVIKPSHMSGVVYRIRGEDPPGPERRREIVEDLYWYLYNDLGFPYGIRPWYESDPRVVVERMLLDDRGKIPYDYKIHCFTGEPRFIQVDVDRFSGHVRTIYDRGWNKLDLALERPAGPGVERPDGLSRMLEIAANLSRGFGYLRVDLYNVAGAVYAGELTPYHGSGLERFRPEKWDLEWGGQWSLPSHEGVERNATDGVSNREHGPTSSGHQDDDHASPHRAQGGRDMTTLAITTPTLKRGRTDRHGG